jgi:ankyrin repeat and zinc finger domain-containing protein 1
MFSRENLEEYPIDVIRLKQLPRRAPPRRTIALMMLGGGHFAGIIASLVPKFVKNHLGGEDRQVDVIASKTFHRYTTRRKQGGTQSSNDAAKGHAHSAGSALRRYNETRLEEQVRELLGEWRELLRTCEFIFIRATGSVNRRTFFGYEGAVMSRNDPRNRAFPFTTRRPVSFYLWRG